MLKFCGTVPIVRTTGSETTEDYLKVEFPAKTYKKGHHVPPALMTALLEFLETLQWATDLTTVNIAAGVFQQNLATVLEAAGVSL